MDNLSKGATYSISDSKGSIDDFQINVEGLSRAFEVLAENYIGNFFEKSDVYLEKLRNGTLDNVNTQNPLLWTSRLEYFSHCLSITSTNQTHRERFLQTEKKVVLLPRCLLGPPQFDACNVKKSKNIGWHKPLGCKKQDCKIDKLVFRGNSHNIDVFVTMGSRGKELPFSRVFKNLKKFYGDVGLLAVACIPELSFGRTYAMEFGIPIQGVPLLWNSCEKWFGENSYSTDFDLDSVLRILEIPEEE